MHIADLIVSTGVALRLIDRALILVLERAEIDV
jgi:hypothetical protein